MPPPHLQWRRPLILVLGVMLAFGPAMPRVGAGPATIVPGAPWKDQRGIMVQGHGGNIIKVGSTFYWFGENKLNENASNAYFQSVCCYSSTDLAHWTFVRDALTRQPIGDLGPDRIVERPKVIYHRAAGRYVMYLHIDRAGYGTGKVGIAWSSSPSGAYTYLGSTRPLGLQSWDINLFQDDDGAAYLLTHASDSHLHIERLSADYLTVVSSVAALRPNYEAPALFKHHGRYYLFGSELTGWHANDNKYTTATNLAGPWAKWNLFAPAGSVTYNSQTMSILPVSGNRGTTFMYLGDRWNAADLGASTYVWLPLQVTETNVWLLGYEHWNLDAATGAWTGNQPPPPLPMPARPSLAAHKPVSTDSEQPENAAANANDDDVTTRWCANDGRAGHWWKVDLGSVCDLGGTEVYWETKGTYQYRIEASRDETRWFTVVDKTANREPSAVMEDKFTASARYVRITVTGLPSGLWASFFECRVFPREPVRARLEATR